jgi:hypothetical protein
VALSGHKNPGIIESEVLMTRQSSPAAIVLVEGWSDARFLGSRLDISRCEIVDTEGKPHLIETIQRLNDRQFHGVIGICDDDCDSLLGHTQDPPNLLRTDTSDLETLLLKSSALDSVLAEHGSVTARRRLADEGKTPHQLLASACFTHGLLRLLAKKLSIPVNFRKFKLHPFLGDGLSLRRSELVSRAALHFSMTEHHLEDELAKISTDDHWAVCNGHDMIAALCLGLQNGTFGSSQAVRPAVESTLRQSLPKDEWVSTELYVNINRWQANTGLRILLP